MSVPEPSYWKRMNVDIMPIGKMCRLEGSIHHRITNLRTDTDSERWEFFYKLNNISLSTVEHNAKILFRKFE